MSTEQSEKEKVIELLLSGQEEMIQIGLMLAESLQIDIGDFKRDIEYAFSTFTGKIYSTFARRLQEVCSLKSVNLSSRKLTALPHQIRYAENIEWLSAVDNQLTELPIEIYSLRKLQFLRLDSNQLSTLPEEIGTLKRLRMLSLINNPIVDTEKEKIKAWLPDCKVQF